MVELQFKPIDPKEVPAKRAREASTQYKALVDEVLSGRQDALEIEVPENRTPKSIYWGLSLYLKKNELREQVEAILREKEGKVYLRKKSSAPATTED